MKLPAPAILGLTFLISEVLLSLAKRARSETSGGDANSLRILWITIGLSIFAGTQAVAFFPGARWPHAPEVALVGVAVFVLGLALRWVAIVQLGRFFTVDVAIAADHKLVQSGVYRFVRHPSYTGALLAFIGFALTLRNWAALIVILVPIGLAFAYRIKVEERVLIAALGARYLDYSRRTKRLLPFIY